MIQVPVAIFLVAVAVGVIEALAIAAEHARLLIVRHTNKALTRELAKARRLLDVGYRPPTSNPYEELRSADTRKWTP